MLKEMNDTPGSLPGPYLKDSVLEASAYFDIVVVYDTEFTSWQGANENGWSGPGQYRELIQPRRYQMSSISAIRRT